MEKPDISGPPQDEVRRHIQSRPDVLGGVPVFQNTRVPVKALFDYLQAGRTVTDFLNDFEGVSPEAVQAVLAAAQEDVLRHIHAA